MPKVSRKKRGDSNIEESLMLAIFPLFSALALQVAHKQIFEYFESKFELPLPASRTQERILAHLSLIECFSPQLRWVSWRCFMSIYSGKNSYPRSEICNSSTPFNKAALSKALQHSHQGSLCFNGIPTKLSKDLALKIARLNPRRESRPRMKRAKM